MIMRIADSLNVSLAFAAVIISLSIFSLRPMLLQFHINDVNTYFMWKIQFVNDFLFIFIPDPSSGFFPKYMDVHVENDLATFFVRVDNRPESPFADPLDPGDLLNRMKQSLEDLGVILFHIHEG